MIARSARARRGILIACLAWWFLYYDFSITGRPAPMPMAGFSWWVDCEDTRARVSRMSPFILVEACTEGDGPPALVAR